MKYTLRKNIPKPDNGQIVLSKSSKSFLRKTKNMLSGINKNWSKMMDRRFTV